MTDRPARSLRETAVGPTFRTIDGLSIRFVESGDGRDADALLLSPWPDAMRPGELVNVDLMVKDSKRFADSGGWGYAVFDYNAASDTFTPGTTAGTPPQWNDARCGFACHTRAKTRDYVFTEYGKR